MLECIFYYQNSSTPLKYSRFLALSKQDRNHLLEEMHKQRNFLIQIIALCLMPNHFHLLLRQIKENGISRFVGNFTNSYTRFFNTKRERVGPLFEGKFKAVRIDTEDQLLHVSRYIHLNPYTGFVIKELETLEDYPYSSFPEYLNKAVSDRYDKSIVLNNFRSIALYKGFVFDQADYQRTLDRIKHLLPK